MNYLCNVRFDKALRIKEGLFVHNYRELLTELRVMSDKEFEENLHKGKRVIDWIKENYNDEKLLQKLEIANRKREYTRILEKRILQLEQQQKCAEKIEGKKMPLYVNVVFFIMFALVIYFFLQYIFENDEDSWKKYVVENEELKHQVEQYSERIILLEKQNLELRNNLSIKEEWISPLEAAVPTPRDRIKISQIITDGSEVSILVSNAYLAEFTDTGSMLPVLGSDATGIQIIPEKESELYPGDVISYRLESGTIVIHRILEIGYDEQGWYAVTKGDNNPLKDGDKVRFHQVERVLIGIIY
ncbi:MAG: hypothetical protein ACP5N3_03530 [Candidatus Nanoarchaeia archaeon]